MKCRRKNYEYTGKYKLGDKVTPNIPVHITYHGIIVTLMHHTNNYGNWDYGICCLCSSVEVHEKLKKDPTYSHSSICFKEYELDPHDA